MCGIAGIFRLGERQLPSKETLWRMAAAIAHRGPDGFGEHTNESVMLAAVRLSVLDVEQGVQPVFNETRSMCAVYNGELYNFRELAAGLRAKGHQLRSAGDTAVLPYLFEEYRGEMTTHLRGMYAFALWDGAERSLFLCRDRLGIKPLYYALTTDFLIFCSEIKGILASGLVSAEIDRDSLDDLFSMSYPCPPSTMFSGIRELLPAHRLVARGAQIRIERYWRASFRERGDHPKLSTPDAIAHFRLLLQDKVKDHLVSDVKVGTYLSGGIDSSLVTSFAQAASPRSLDSFTISFAGHHLDEGGVAAKVAQRLGVQHHLVPCMGEAAELFEQAVFHTELPLQYPLASAFIKLSQAVKAQGVKVILTGEGADELLAGYDCFRLERVRRWLDKPLLRGLRPHIYRRMFGWLGSPAGLAEELTALHRRPNAEIEKEFGGVRPPWFDAWNLLHPERDLLLASGGRRIRPISEAPVGFAQLVRDRISHLHPLDAALSIELETRLPNWTVLIDDRASMANGVETRVPFLDHELVDWTTQLHPDLKLKALRDKYILREAARGILPDEIRNRAKRPFYSPISELFLSDRRLSFVDEMLSESSLRRSQLFAPGVVSRLRARLKIVPSQTIERHRLEWLLILVLGTQVLHRLFVEKQSSIFGPIEQVIARLPPPMREERPPP